MNIVGDADDNIIVSFLVFNVIDTGTRFDVDVIDIVGIRVDVAVEA